jgi:hypothetical protein
VQAINLINSIKSDGELIGGMVPVYQKEEKGEGGYKELLQMV